MSETIIKTEGLSKRYGGITAVDKLFLEIRKGEVFGLLGPNGAGKTTTTLMLLGLTEPSGGRAQICGYDCTRDSLQVKKITGYLPDNVGFYPDMTGRQNLRFTGRLNGLQGEELEKRIDEMLKRVGMTNAADRKTGTYSRGMKQRLGIADVLMKDPQIIIMDEPTLGIDPEGMRELLALIRQLSEEDQRTILISSHQLHQVQQICDRVGIFVKGKLIACGSVGELAVQLQSEGNYILELEAYPHDDRLENLLHTVEGVKKITKENEMILVHSDRDCHNDVIVTLLMNGYDLRRLRQRGGDLDEIYSKYFEKAGETYDSDTGKRKGFRDNFRSLVRHALGKGK
ncbi:ABC transporter ATP-binding protein [Eisenbergiella tayi]|uniref:Putative ABC transporter ATP-binding protein YxlF n=1 Tax=Eisenbergiella tayi TaxID=1432052 RepID=A0A1E3AMN2_9FIRM|nr:ABC transporter ATP-binding protein [Eisenbergiella tayi]ODM09950.1 putative ABC transporter ATP-binding protein YxlF [Eisenbergiella tayi]